MKRLLFIYNPNAGTGRGLRELAQVIDTLANSDYEVVVYRTKRSLDATEKVAKDGAGFDLICCLGGDGTLSEVVKGLMELENRPPVAFIPAGSTNDTAKSFGIPVDMPSAAKLALRGTPKKTDVGSFNGDHFVYVASFGEISTISAFTPRELKKALGHAAYVIEGIRVIPKMRAVHMKVEYDEHTLEGDFYLGMISNSYQVAGFQGIAGGHVDLADGLFEVTLFAGSSNPIGYAYQIKDVLIQPDSEGSDYLIRLKANHIKITSSEPIQWVTDGEDAGIHDLIEVNVEKEAFEIVVGN